MNKITTENGLNLHVASLPSEPNRETRRSMITLSGTDRPGLMYGIASIFGDRKVNVQNSSSRRFQDIHGAQYVVASPVDEIEGLSASEVIARCEDDGFEEIDRTNGTPYHLSAIVPDKPGVLAIISQMMLRKKIHVMTSDAITFETNGPGKLANQTITASSISMTFVIGNDRHDEHLQGLLDGLDYLENRYQWHLQLEKRPDRTASSGNFDQENWFQRAILNGSTAN